MQGSYFPVHWACQQFSVARVRYCLHIYKLFFSFLCLKGTSQGLSFPNQNNTNYCLMAEHAVIRQGSLHWQLQIMRGVPWEVNDYLLFAVHRRDKAASLFPGCGADRSMWPDCFLSASVPLSPWLLYYSCCNWFVRGLGARPHEQACFLSFCFSKKPPKFLSSSAFLNPA